MADDNAPTNLKRPPDDNSSLQVCPSTTAAGNVAHAKSVTPDRPIYKKSRVDEEEIGRQDDSLEEGGQKPAAVQDGAPSFTDVAIQQQDQQINGDSIMGFNKYPTTSNRDILLKHFDFVRWAKNLENPYGRIPTFLEWTKSPEGKMLELEGRGNEKFTYGQYNGCTFSQVAIQDPDYHSRYQYVLKKKNQKPDGVLKRYIKWFKENKRLKSKSSHTSSNEPEKGYVETPASGSEKFHSGQHKGETFSHVARYDPDYHIRYLAMRKPPAEMKRYLAYFAKYGDHVAAQQANHDNLASYAGIMPVCAFGNY